jgi:hypothetical protein
MSKAPNMEQDDYHKAQFAHLVMMFASSTLQHLGRLPTPAGGKSEVDLEAAQATIDMLDMLAAKTRGNLDPEETRMLNETLTGLKLQFVEASPPGGARPAAPGPGPAASPAPPPASSAGPAAPPSPNDDDRKKYHKSYG